MADAIRMAAAEPVPSGQAKPSAPAFAVHEMPVVEPVKPPSPPRLKRPKAESEECEPKEISAEEAPEPPQVSAGNVVRLEMFLSNEQMSTMLKALMAGQHSILTLREAATFLRVSPNHLLELAESGEVPGLLLDGRWRFPRQTLEEWVYQEGMKQENRVESSDVA